ncbi:MAG: DNA adenine methylase [Sandaracinaceae bacterium]|nr:DNA adenine methylase [Sandaracinaceae bacterium]
MIKYLGSKRVLIPQIVALVDALPRIKTCFDVFSGTSRVGHALKGRGYSVTANDHNTYAHTLALCYVAADRAKVLKDATKLIEELRRVKPKAGWFTATYCEGARYFQPKNGERIDAMREHIEKLSLSPELRAVLLVSLMEAADRVDSTVGVQMAYLKSWAARSSNDLELRVPDLVNGQGRALCMDAKDAAVEVGSVDLAYLDPPYNQHSYRGNYHVWESLVQWDKPEVYGIAQKRTDVREHKSEFNSKKKIHAALGEVLDALNARFLIVSFSNEGYIAPEDMVTLLEARGRVHSVALDFKRYVGARIGIYNPSGEKVGAVGRLKNQEHLFLLDRDSALAKGKLLLETAMVKAL